MGSPESSSNGMIQVSIKNLLKRVEEEKINRSQSRPSIYMVPENLRNLSPDSFNPRVVSIGPLHRGDENLKYFEMRKATYLEKLMGRVSSPQEETLQTCVKKAYASMQKIRESYILKKKYEDDEIAEMMVMDACFILEFILSFHDSQEVSHEVSDSKLRVKKNMLKQVFHDSQEVSDSKPHVRKNMLAQAVFYDMGLLENQIPFFFLKKIFRCTISKFKPDLSVIKFLHPVLDHLMLFEGDRNFENIPVDTTSHILSLLHECYKPRDRKDQITLSSPIRSPIRSVIDLDRAGVHLRPNKNPKWPMEMEVKSHSHPCFCWPWSNTTLRMPVLKIHHFSEMVLRNLIAYEQLRQTEKCITSYVVAMDMMVNTQEDVAMLIDSRVLINYMGSNEEAANMINSLSKEVARTDFFYGDQVDKLNAYCNSYWPKHIANVRRTYFSNPWNMIALVAGIILFTLTVVQTIYTIP